MGVPRVLSRVRSCLSGLFITAFMYVIISCIIGSTIQWTLNGAKSIETLQELILFLLEWSILSFLLTILVVGSLTATVILLYLFPQQLPMQSISFGYSILVRLCRLEVILVWIVLGLTSLLWNGIFCLLVDKELYISSFLLILCESLLLSLFLAFKPYHLLSQTNDTNPTLFTLSPRLIVSVAQCFLITFAVSLLGVWYGIQPFSFSAIISSTSLYFVVLHASWKFSSLYLEPGYSWTSSGTSISWLELHHPSMTCSKCTDVSLLHRKQQTTFLSIRTSPTQNQLKFLQNRLTSAAKEGPSSCLRPMLRSLEFWENYFQASDINVAATNEPTVLFANESVWPLVLQATTASIDTLTLQLNTISQWKQSPATRSVLNDLVHIVWHLLSSPNDNPVAVIDKNPIVHSILVSSGQAVPSLFVWIEKWFALALWQWILAIIFLSTQSIVYSIDALAKIAVASYSKDKQGIVQLSLPGILYTLVSCRLALEAVRVPQIEEYDVVSHALDNALVKIVATFKNVLADLCQGFPSSHTTKLKSYLSK